MTTGRTFSDEDLTAFLDGEADDALAREIEAALEADQDLAARLEGLTVPIAALQRAFDTQLSAAPAMPDVPSQVSANANAAPKRGFLPGLGIGLVAGITGAAIVITSLQPAQKEPGWLDIVANYQMLYVPETLDPPRKQRPGGDNRSGNYAADLASLSDIVGTDLEGLYKIEGLKFHRAQLLGFRGKPLIQVAYSLPDGTPVAICIVPSDAGEKAPRAQVLQGMASSDWTTGSHGVLVIGGTDQAIVNDIAKTVVPLI